MIKPPLCCILLTIIVIVGACLRMHEINRQSLWIDELLSLEISNGRGFVERELPYGKVMNPAPDLTSLSMAAPMWRIIPEQVVESHPPLYFLTLRAWREVFHGDTAARVLSVIFSLVSIVLIYRVGRELSGAATGLWAAAILAVAGSQINVAGGGGAQDIRPYQMLLCLVLVGVDVLLRIRSRGFTPGRAVLLGVSILAMMWTHYFAVAAVVGMFIYTLAVFHGADRRKTLGVLIASSALFLLAWGPIVVRQTHNLSENNAWLNEGRRGHLHNTLDRLLSLPIRLLGEPYEDGRNPTAKAGLILAAALLVYPIELLRRRGYLLLPLLLFVLPVGLILGLDLTRSTWHLYVLRYSVVAAAGLALLLASPVIDRSFLRHIIPATAVMYGLLSLPATYTPWKEDYRGIAQMIDASSLSVPIVIFSNSGDHWEGGLYLGLRHYSSGNHPVVVLTKPADEALISELRKYGDVWVVCGWKYVDDPQRDILPGAELLAKGTMRAEKIGIVYHMRFPKAASKPL